MLQHPKHIFQNPEFLAQGWGALFEKEQPLTLEIGCGHGQFLIYMAEKHPEQNFIGLDIINKILIKVEKRIATLGLKNAIPCKMDANLALRELFPEGSLDNIYILFPDPWPKDKHERRRMVRPENLPVFINILKAGGHLHFVSDAPPYAAQVEALLNERPEFKRVDFPEGIDIKTKYEKKWLEQHKYIQRFSYQKISETVPENWPSTSPEVSFQLTDWSPTKNDAIYHGFEPYVHKFDGKVIKLRKVYREFGSERIMLQAVLAQPELMSHDFFVFVAPNGDCELPKASYLPRVLGYKDVLAGLADAIVTFALNK